MPPEPAVSLEAAGSHAFGVLLFGRASAARKRTQPRDTASPYAALLTRPSLESALRTVPRRLV